MISPHESLELNPKRGLLAAVLGNPSTYPGLVSIYDVSQDCRHPVLQSTRPVARLGHESGFSQDGKTFYASGTAIEGDLRDRRDRPQEPARDLAGQRHLPRHDAEPRRQPRLHRRPGRRAADPRHQRDPGAQGQPAGARGQPPDLEARRRSRRTRSRSPCDGKPYVLEFDEYTAGHDRRRQQRRGGRRRASSTSPTSAAPKRGLQPAPAGQPAGRPRGGAQRPRRLQPGPGLRRALLRPLDAEVDPTVVACSFIASGPARVRHQRAAKPKEIAYYVAPTQPRARTGSGQRLRDVQARDRAGRREVWYTRRRDRLLQSCAWRRGVARGRGAAAAAAAACARAVADRAAQHRPRAARA